MSIDSQIERFIEDQEDTIPEYLIHLFRSVQQESLKGSGASSPTQEALDAGDKAEALDQATASLSSLPRGMTPEAFGSTIRGIEQTYSLNLSNPFSSDSRSIETRVNTAVDMIDNIKGLGLPISPEMIDSLSKYGPSVITQIIGNLVNPDQMTPKEVAEKLAERVETYTIAGRKATASQKEKPDTSTGSTVSTASVGSVEAMQEAARSGIGEIESQSSVGRGDVDAGPDDSSGGGGSAGGPSGDQTGAAEGMGTGYLNTGGRVGALIQHLQTGGEAENADTNMEVANVPMGVVSDADGAPGPFSGGTGVEDDLDMEVEAGSYVLNAEAVQLIGISDINEVIRDAYSIAVALGKEVPTDYDPQNKVPIRISNGEAIIPKALVEIIGLDKLEKWNQKGLQLRKQKEKFMAQQQQQQPQGPQVAAEAPMQQQMGQLMDRGGEVEGDFDISMSQADAQRKDAEEAWEKFMSTTEPEKPEPSVMNSRAEPLVKTAASGSSKVKQLSSDDTILGGSGDDILDKKVQPVKPVQPVQPVEEATSYNVLTGQVETTEQTKKGFEEKAEKVESFLDIGNSSPEEIQKTVYKVGKKYKARDIRGAINVVSKVLGNSEVQKNTKSFLTEIVNAESSFGRDETTNKKESNIVGPWQVGMGDNQAYTEILIRLDPTSPVYRPKLQENLDKFIATSWGKEIDWLNLSKKDMMNPLINATIARLYISTMDEDAIPADKTKRAELWKRIYNTKADKKGTVAYYLSKNLDMP